MIMIMQECRAARATTRRDSSCKCRGSGTVWMEGEGVAMAGPSSSATCAYNAMDWWNVDGVAVGAAGAEEYPPYAP